MSIYTCNWYLRKYYSYESENNSIMSRIQLLSSCIFFWTCPIVLIILLRITIVSMLDPSKP